MRIGMVEAFAVALALLLASISAQSQTGNIGEVSQPLKAHPGRDLSQPMHRVTSVVNAN